MAESSYDHFGVGHSSTSISAALGIALARDLSFLKHHVLAVIGDGSLTALTLHALLGKRPGSMTRFRHHADNPLPHDVVVVDEMSMVSMVMMSRLLEALKPSARLVMVGDPDQLSSVDAGSVLADITRAPAAAGIVARLVRNYRFTGAIADLATAIRTGDADAALAVLTGPDPSVRLAGVAEGATGAFSCEGSRGAADATGAAAGCRASSGIETADGSEVRCGARASGWR